MESEAVSKLFEAAVTVIKNLPKEGPFQPSNEVKLKFYAYYKQATVGVCTEHQPRWWNVVQKAKWEAWHSLGKLSKVDAMQRYVDELKKIVETMPHTVQVSEFLHLVGPFYEAVGLQEISGQKQVDDSTGLSHVQEDTASGLTSTDPDVTVHSDDCTSPVEPCDSGLSNVGRSISDLPQPLHSVEVTKDSSSDSEVFEDSVGPEDVRINQQAKAKEDQIRGETDHQLHSHHVKPLPEAAETLTLPDYVVEDQRTLCHHGQVIDALGQLQAAVTAISQQLHTMQASLSSLSMQIQSHMGEGSSEQPQRQRRVFPLISGVLRFCRTRAVRIGIGVLLILFLFAVLPVCPMQRERSRHW